MAYYSPKNNRKRKKNKRRGRRHRGAGIGATNGEEKSGYKVPLGAALGVAALVAIAFGARRR